MIPPRPPGRRSSRRRPSDAGQDPLPPPDGAAPYADDDDDALPAPARQADEAPREAAPRARAPRARSAPRSSPRTPRAAPPPDPLRDRDEPAPRAAREPREVREPREREPREVREPREREPREVREPREREPREAREPREREPREAREPREREPREAREPREREVRDDRDARDSRDDVDSREMNQPLKDWAAVPRELRENKAQGTSLVAGRLPTGEIAGHVVYRGSQTGDAVVVGLFDASQPGTQLEYWVELDGPGPYVLDGLKPGRYELHACMASSISESGLPREILATGVFKSGIQISINPGDVLDGRDVEIYDELPAGMLQGIDTVFYDVSDIEQSVAFYRDVLNLPLTLQERSWAEFDTGSCILALRRKPEPPPGYRAPVRRAGEGGGAQVVFRVRDLEKVREELVHRGVKFLGRVIEIPEARWSTFTDPDGNKMQLFERKTR